VVSPPIIIDSNYCSRKWSVARQQREVKSEVTVPQKTVK
jgi:hypothetical protein